MSAASGQYSDFTKNKQVEGGLYVLFLCAVKSRVCGWEAGDKQQGSVTPGLAGQWLCSEGGAAAASSSWPRSDAPVLDA